VRAGATDLEWVEILDGIKEGEKVVLLGDAARAHPATVLPLRLAQGVGRSSARAATQAGSVQ